MAEGVSDGTVGPATVAALIGGIAAGLDDVRSGPSQGSLEGSEHSRAGTVFARVAGDSLEVRLPEDIAEAAIRTPDTLPLPGQPGCVRFTPSSAERHVLDRAEAWFRTAWRHAEPRARG